MPLSVEGNDIVFAGQVRVVNGFNPDTGVAYLVLTPEGGTGQLPFLANGEPGLPPTFEFDFVPVHPDDPLPSPNPDVVLIDPGGPGVASHYSLTFYNHTGADGDPGTFNISGAADLSETPGSGTDGYILVYNHSTGKWVLSAQRVGNAYVSPAISATSGSTASRTLSSISIPAQPFNWRPRVFAQTLVSGTANTRVDLVARIGDASTGDQVGFSKGVAGAAPPPNVLIPAYPTGEAVPGSYGRVGAGQAATIHLVAEQKASTGDNWATPASPDTTFCVEVQPVP